MISNSTMGIQVKNKFYVLISISNKNIEYKIRKLEYRYNITFYNFIKNLYFYLKAKYFQYNYYYQLPPKFLEENPHLKKQYEYK
jgi:hypothetical protein